MKKTYTKYYLVGLAASLAALYFLYKPEFVPPTNFEHNADGAIVKHHDQQPMPPAPAVAATPPEAGEAPVASTGQTKTHVEQTATPVAKTSPKPPTPTPTPTPAKTDGVTPDETSRTEATPPASKTCHFNKDEKLLLGLTGPAAERLWRQAISKCNLLDYKVRAGDSLTSISLKFFGDARYWTKIWSNNPGVDQPYDLEVGTVLLFERDDIDTATGQLSWYEVQPEDKNLTFSDLAERLGNRAWGSELARQNPKLKKQDTLKAGQNIRIDTERLPSND